MPDDRSHLAVPPDLAHLPDPPHEERTGSSRAFDGKLLHVRVDQVRLPSGRESVREVVEHPGSVVIVPVTAGDEVILIRQFRHAAGRPLLELPAGLIDDGEETLEAAARELREETGYEAGTLRHLATVFMTPGYSDERAAIVLAEGCVATDHEPDPDEPIQIVKLPISEVPALLEPGASLVEDAQGLIGLLWLLRLRGMDDQAAS